ncbi:hypothetical protein G7Y89_g8069 [Cudoniella acicularis]|uniref:Short-chain dehydrogenase/reductase n=1 Tax=Cudoniella acicularis TaxID=354080 RepID=A0A8H4W0Y3_9HELO|nr:hypothetical protein G7Y89_g8069 [Cudoniella acicularis]
MSELRNQFVSLPYPSVDCTGRTIAVVGANIGLGKEAVRHFVRLNASKVIMAVRSIEKGEDAKIDIEETTKRTGVLEVWKLDLTSYASVLSFAARLENEPRVDAVVANASIATQKFEMAEDNESTITVNVISTLLLVLLVLPIMRASAERWNIHPAITVVSSGIHSWIKFPEWEAPNCLEALNNPKAANMNDRYAASKLLQVFAVDEIASKMGGKSKVVLNIISPGLVKTALGRNATGFTKFSLALMKFLMARTPEMGSRTLVHAATAGPESHGKYFTDCDITLDSRSDFVKSADGLKAQQKIWDEIAKKLEAIQPGVTGNI